MATTATQDQQHRIATILAIAMFIAAPMAYLAVVYALSASQPTAPKPQPILLYVLLAIALLQVTVALPLVTRSMRANSQRIAQGTAAQSPALSVMIVRMAMVESVFVFGLVYFFVTRDVIPVLYFYAIGLLAVLFYWPTRERFDEIANAMETP